MNCQDFEELLSSYIDHELNQAETRLVEDHLAVCPGCSVRLERLQAAAAEVGMLKPAVMTDRAAAKLLSAVTGAMGQPQPVIGLHERLGRVFTRPAWRYAVSSFAALAIAAVVWSAQSHRPFDQTGRLQPKSAQSGRDDLAPEALETKKQGIPRSGVTAPTEAGKFPTFERQQLDTLANTAGNANPYEEQDAKTYTGRPNDQRFRTAPDPNQPDLSDTGIDADKAAAIAAEGGRATLLSATRGEFEDKQAWIIVIRLEDSGNFLAAAVAEDTAEVLYKTKPR